MVISWRSPAEVVSEPRYQLEVQSNVPCLRDIMLYMGIAILALYQL